MKKKHTHVEIIIYSNQQKGRRLTDFVWKSQFSPPNQTTRKKKAVSKQRSVLITKLVCRGGRNSPLIHPNSEWYIH